LSSLRFFPLSTAFIMRRTFALIQF
jgi:hypothetical protein